MNNTPSKSHEKEWPEILHGHIYLIEDSADIRKHLSSVLERYGLTVEAYEDAESFLSQSVEVAPAVVLLDMALPGINGLATFQKLTASGRKTPVVYLSGQSEPQEIIDALQMGAHDFLWKPFSIEKLIATVSKALKADETRISRHITESLVERLWATLTEREQGVCRLALKSYNNSQIAHLLGVMPDTAKKHRARIMEKMGVATLAELVALFEGVSLK